MRAPAIRHLTNEHGATLPMVAVSIVALLSMAALAVDMGMLFTGKNEAQRTADAAALAGVTSFISYPDAFTAKGAAWIRAAQYTRANPITNVAMGTEVPAESETTTAYVYTTDDLAVSVFKNDDRVGALTQRSPISLWFARVFGEETSMVNAYAEALVVNGGLTDCLKPLLIADRWSDNGDGIWGTGDSYDRARDGWDQDNFGHQLDLVYLDQQWNNNSTLQMNSFLPFRFPGDAGGKDLLNAITRQGCGYDQSVGVGDPVEREPGLTWGSFEKAWEDLIAADQAANGNFKYENGQFYKETSNGWVPTEEWQSSYRVVPVAFFDPSQLLCTSSTGKTEYCPQFDTSGFVNIFIEDTFQSGNTKGVRVHIIGPVTGSIGDCEATNTCSPDIKAIRLVN